MRMFTLSAVVYPLVVFSLLPRCLPAQWSRLTTGTTENLTDIHFLTTSYGVAVGESGTVLLTTDSGLHWNEIGQDLSADLGSVWVWSVDTLLVAGKEGVNHETYQSTTSGNDWQLTEAAFEVSRMDNRLLAIGYDYFRWSEDRGLTWMEGLPVIGGTTLLSELEIADAEVAVGTGNISGFVAYSFYAYRSSNKGESWDPLYVFDLPNADAWTASSYPHRDTLFVFTNEQINFLPGPNNSLVRLTDFYFDTTNGINSWRFDGQVINSQMPTYVHDAAFLDAWQGYVVGEDGHIYETLDGGENWTSIYEGDIPLRSIVLLDQQMGFVVGDNGLVLKNENLTDTQKPQEAPQLKLWPNPSRDMLKVEGIQLASTTISIYDSMGRLLRHFQWQKNEDISLVELPAGVYHLSIQLERQQLSFKIVKL